MKLAIIITTVIICFGVNMSYASDYVYEKRETDKQIIHIVTLNPKHYEINLMKANDGTGGRETVPAMAKRSQAEIAINGGFFDIGGDREGAPSGTLVIKGHPYHIRNKVQPLFVIDLGTPSIVQLNPKKQKISSNISMVSGIPLLIKDGSIVETLAKKNSAFYTKPHARTALGIKSEGTIAIVVTEQGLSILALAELMKELGCQNALNLDGGGSATLWIKDKVVNNIFGDIDEDNGLQTIRPVSDAIVFKHHPI